MGHKLFSSHYSSQQDFKEGDKVSVSALPDWLVEAVDENSLKNIHQCLQADLQIIKIEDENIVWLEAIIENSDNEWTLHQFAIDIYHIVKN
ncbi:hypothetical protein [Pleionea sp. CnH1-48]|uniref:hypothetical protein n=1 Tax=Pleionea sp. CnH1-48 TaxID=2954494 RepID=UPI0020980BBE|nr:hypothetical protein [Pleionea sp. CnH1-48]MCO7224715.1 hypothetical protein [Pleionea sp. CnH1-48]